jgi:hypothetical protein
MGHFILIFLQNYAVYGTWLRQLNKESFIIYIFLTLFWRFGVIFGRTRIPNTAVKSGNLTINPNNFARLVKNTGFYKKLDTSFR